MWWLLLTIPLYLGAFASFPNYICGCHFHAAALAPSIPPALWGFYVFARYRTWGERVLAWFCVLLSLFWLFLAWEANVKFFFVYW